MIMIFAEEDRRGLTGARVVTLRRVDKENIALALTGVIKRDSFSVGRPFGRSVATARLGALPNTGSIRVHNMNFKVGSGAMISSQHSYEVRPRVDRRGVDLISDALPFGTLWYGEPDAVSNAFGYAEHYSRSQNALIRVYDAIGNVIETREHQGDFKEW